eukprot:gnl/MRDRNA2_/MRDRNA2_87947_c0_seq1.p1 gnl/MRDRNA2_/MRDRNA2_87947_c0~~gnl/MRDRNA2_/MRDRNA2_87947_c0_seq1.p1  ORF type:complete len:143 (+),score=25.14 gnl/MRDRNA2_/MRDRNA2_87947_c0_seq1:82-510(+)
MVRDTAVVAKSGQRAHEGFKSGQRSDSDDERQLRCTHETKKQHETRHNLAVWSSELQTFLEAKQSNGKMEKGIQDVFKNVHSSVPPGFACKGVSCKGGAVGRAHAGMLNKNVDAQKNDADAQKKHSDGSLSLLFKMPWSSAH